MSEDHAIGQEETLILMLLCPLCGLRARLTGTPVPLYNETAEEHMERVHDNPYAAYREQQMLQGQLYERGLAPPEKES